MALLDYRRAAKGQHRSNWDWEQAGCWMLNTRQVNAAGAFTFSKTRTLDSWTDSQPHSRVNSLETWRRWVWFGRQVVRMLTIQRVAGAVADVSSIMPASTVSRIVRRYPNSDFVISIGAVLEESCTLCPCVCASSSISFVDLRPHQASCRVCMR
jgi:hypothetical protein